MTNLEQQKAEHESYYIPLEPGIRRRRGLMFMSLMPGILLIISAMDDRQSGSEGMLIRLFCVLVGAGVIFASVKEFRKPGSVKWMSADFSVILAGLLLIAQGASIFKAVKGFQPSHLYFITGTLLIFKGAMYPEARVKRGFVVDEDTIKYRARFFSKTISIPRRSVIKIERNETSLIFHTKDGLHVSINLKDAANRDSIFEQLNALLSLR